MTSHRTSRTTRTRVWVLAFVLVAIAGCGSQSSTPPTVEATSQATAAAVPTTTSVTTTEAPTTTITTTTTTPTTTTTAARLGCDATTLQDAYNARFDQNGYPYTLEYPRCAVDVAVGFITSTMPDSQGSPDFGYAFFLARDGQWVALLRLRTPMPSDEAKLVEAGMTAEQAALALALASENP